MQEPPPSPPPLAPWAPPQASAQPGAGGVHGLVWGSVLGRLAAWWIDSLIVGLGGGLIAALAGALAGGLSPTPAGQTGLALVVTLVVSVGLSLLYFVGFWTGPARATPGMRLVALQIGRSHDGAPLAPAAGIIRWIALGVPLEGLASVPGLYQRLSGFYLLWILLLLGTTLVDRQRLGLHDRLAGSAMVQPAGSRAPVLACLGIVGVMVILTLGLLLALVFLGSQMSGVLSAVGASV